MTVGPVVSDGLHVSGCPTVNVSRDHYVVTALFLVYEACYNQYSYWAPYFRLLPTQFPG